MSQSEPTLDPLLLYVLRNSLQLIRTMIPQSLLSQDGISASLLTTEWTPPLARSNEIVSLITDLQWLRTPQPD